MKGIVLSILFLSNTSALPFEEVIPLSQKVPSTDYDGHANFKEGFFYQAIELVICHSAIKTL